MKHYKLYKTEKGSWLIIRPNGNPWSSSFETMKMAIVALDCVPYWKKPVTKMNRFKELQAIQIIYGKTFIGEI